MKVLILNGSPRSNGDTAYILEKVKGRFPRGTGFETLNAYAAEWTVSFEHVLYLVSMKFDSSEKYGDGTIVTSEGISHTLILKR